jgi:hypothetical protein
VKRRPPPLDLLRDTLARLTRAAEALRHGELELAEQILDELGADLWQAIEKRLYICDRCGNAYPWPGLLDRHLLVTDCRKHHRDPRGASEADGAA